MVMSIAGWKTNLLRVYYNREPKKTLELVRFSSDLGHSESRGAVKTKIKTPQKCLFILKFGKIEGLFSGTARGN